MPQHSLSLLLTLITLAPLILSRPSKHSGENDSDIFGRPPIPASVVSPGNSPLVPPVIPSVLRSTAIADQFLVKGDCLPGVSSQIGDVGDSWAGKLAISPGDFRKLFFWLWPPEHYSPQRDETLTIWLQGGPGASSLKGLLQEIGPFLLPLAQEGPARVVRNEYSFTKASWLLVVDQPAGVGLGDGPSGVSNEDDVAEQFTSWLLNLMTVFPNLQHKNIALVAESYAGQYVFHIADYIFTNTRLRLKNLGLVSAILTDRKLQQQAGMYEFVARRQKELHIGDAELADMKEAAEEDGIATFVTDNLKYPPAGKIEAPAPLADDHDWLQGVSEAVRADQDKGCLNIYNIAQQCPLPAFDPLGVPPGGNATLGQSTEVNWINDTPGFLQSVHAQGNVWRLYQSTSPFVNGRDQSPYPMQTELFENVVRRMNRVVISAGLDDMAIIPLGTQLAVQSGIWRGYQGFFSGEQTPLIVNGQNKGTHHTERGLTLALVKGAGHEIPQYQPDVALHLHRYLIGQIDNL